VRQDWGKCEACEEEIEIVDLPEEPEESAS